MKRELWDKLVEEIARENPMTELWPTFYGEALVLGDELWDRINYAAEVGCKNIVLNSNGTLLSLHNNYDKILDSPLKRFILSLDGFKKETFEKIRYLGKWDSVYPQVEELLKRKAERGQLYPAIICQFSEMKENASEIPEFRQYWRSRGAEVKVRPMLEWTTTGSIRSNKIDHNTSFRISCPWGNNTMAVHQDGNVVACAVDYEGRFKAGNAYDKSLKELWVVLREKLRKPHHLHQWGNIPNICKGCGDWQVAGAEYEEEQVPDTRPFWFAPANSNNSK